MPETSWNPPAQPYVQHAPGGDLDAAVAAAAGDDVVSRYGRAVLLAGAGVRGSPATETEGEPNAVVRNPWRLS
jgi:hypothetical protein